MRFALLLILTATWAPAWAPAWADLSARAPIDNFHLVHEGIYRGALPGATGLAYLSDLGVRTVVDLVTDDEGARGEAAIADALGLRHVWVPLSPVFGPSERDMDTILDVLEDSSAYPIFVHCRHGEDRTGLAIGLHRIRHDGWERSRAYDEMLERGFHPYLVGLTQYFFRYASGRLF